MFSNSHTNRQSTKQPQIISLILSKMMVLLFLVCLPLYVPKVILGSCQHLLTAFIANVAMVNKNLCMCFPTSSVPSILFRVAGRLEPMSSSHRVKGKVHSG